LLKFELKKVKTN